ncbi:MAG: aminotransferase class I/II-fold pyridoxal phosphate-dependent enzyme [Candidatus Melainabacteria bacterium]
MTTATETPAALPAKALRLVEAAEARLRRAVWPRMEAIAQTCFQRVIEAFQAEKIGEEHFYSVTGYGHDDLGRAATDRVFARALQAESALVRTQIVSGTHAIAVGLRGCLEPGDTLLCITGAPYDTLEEVLGIRGDQPGSLKRQGIHYQEVSAFEGEGEEAVLPESLPQAVCLAIPAAKVVYIQRSRGYSLRPTLSIANLRRMIEQIRLLNPKAIVFVDNCYGEFTDTDEPTGVGADLMAGSLIKNPGGGLAPTGGYIAGRTDLVTACANALTCPGVGAKGGYTFDLSRTLLQGLFMAPGAVLEAMKGMTLAASVFEAAGYATTPCATDVRGDIIQAIRLGSAEKVVRFCQLVQRFSPVNAYVSPEPAVVPGYSDAVVMAGGTFIDGATLEFSADGPLRAPYTVFLQGGLTYLQPRLAMIHLLDALGEHDPRTP